MVHGVLKRRYRDSANAEIVKPLGSSSGSFRSKRLCLEQLTVKCSVPLTRLPAEILDEYRRKSEEREKEIRSFGKSVSLETKMEEGIESEQVGEITKRSRVIRNDTNRRVCNNSSQEKVTPTGRRVPDVENVQHSSKKLENCTKESSKDSVCRDINNKTVNKSSQNRNLIDGDKLKDCDPKCTSANNAVDINQQRHREAGETRSDSNIEYEQRKKEHRKHKHRSRHESKHKESCGMTSTSREKSKHKESRDMSSTSRDKSRHYHKRKNSSHSNKDNRNEGSAVPVSDKVDNTVQAKGVISSGNDQVFLDGQVSSSLKSGEERGGSKDVIIDQCTVAWPKEKVDDYMRELAFDDYRSTTGNHIHSKPVSAEEIKTGDFEGSSGRGSTDRMNSLKQNDQRDTNSTSRVSSGLSHGKKRSHELQMSTQQNKIVKASQLSGPSMSDIPGQIDRHQSLEQEEVLLEPPPKEEDKSWLRMYNCSGHSATRGVKEEEPIIIIDDDDDDDDADAEDNCNHDNNHKLCMVSNLDWLDEPDIILVCSPTSEDELPFVLPDSSDVSLDGVISVESSAHEDRIEIKIPDRVLTNKQMCKRSSERVPVTIKNVINTARSTLAEPHKLLVLGDRIIVGGKDRMLISCTVFLCYNYQYFFENIVNEVRGLAEILYLTLHNNLTLNQTKTITEKFVHRISVEINTQGTKTMNSTVENLNKTRGPKFSCVFNHIVKQFTSLNTLPNFYQTLFIVILFHKIVIQLYQIDSENTRKQFLNIRFEMEKLLEYGKCKMPIVSLLTMKNHPDFVSVYNIVTYSITLIKAAIGCKYKSINRSLQYLVPPPPPPLVSRQVANDGIQSPPPPSAHQYHQSPSISTTTTTEQHVNRTTHSPGEDSTKGVDHSDGADMSNELPFHPSQRIVPRSNVAKMYNRYVNMEKESDGSCTIDLDNILSVSGIVRVPKTVPNSLCMTTVSEVTNTHHERRQSSSQGLGHQEHYQMPNTMLTNSFQFCRAESDTINMSPVSLAYPPQNALVPRSNVTESENPYINIHQQNACTNNYNNIHSVYNDNAGTQVIQNPVPDTRYINSEDANSYLQRNCNVSQEFVSPEYNYSSLLNSLAYEGPQHMPGYEVGVGSNDLQITKTNHVRRLSDNAQRRLSGSQALNYTLTDSQGNKVPPQLPYNNRVPLGVQNLQSTNCNPVRGLCDSSQQLAQYHDSGLMRKWSQPKQPKTVTNNSLNYLHRPQMSEISTVGNVPPTSASYMGAHLAGVPSDSTSQQYTLPVRPQVSEISTMANVPTSASYMGAHLAGVPSDSTSQQHTLPVRPQVSEISTMANVPTSASYMGAHLAGVPSDSTSQQHTLPVRPQVSGISTMANAPTSASYMGTHLTGVPSYSTSQQHALPVRPQVSEISTMANVPTSASYMGAHLARVPSDSTSQQHTLPVWPQVSGISTMANAPTSASYMGTHLAGVPSDSTSQQHKLRVRPQVSGISTMANASTSASYMGTHLAGVASDSTSQQPKIRVRPQVSGISTMANAPTSASYMGAHLGGVPSDSTSQQPKIRVRPQVSGISTMANVPTSTSYMGAHLTGVPSDSTSQQHKLPVRPQVSKINSVANVPTSASYMGAHLAGVPSSSTSQQHKLPVKPQLSEISTVANVPTSASYMGTHLAGVPSDSTSQQHTLPVAHTQQPNPIGGCIPLPTTSRNNYPYHPSTAQAQNTTVRVQDGNNPSINYYANYGRPLQQRRPPPPPYSVSNYRAPRPPQLPQPPRLYPMPPSQ